MKYPISAAERAAFLGCRRRWDFGSANRMNLEPAPPPLAPDLGRALKDALAIYYFPGMWDWPRDVVLRTTNIRVAQWFLAAPSTEACESE
ncbi:MAG: hypothetical protein ACRDYY_07770 [Acidimicrobiales bacterium]